jgi:hypothetical protein
MLWFSNILSQINVGCSSNRLFGLRTVMTILFNLKRLKGRSRAAFFSERGLFSKRLLHWPNRNWLAAAYIRSRPIIRRWEPG